MPVKSNPNIVLTYNSVNITQYCDTATMDATLETIETTNLASTATESTPGDTTWTYDIGGSWAKALDDVFGPDVITPPATLRTFSAAIGAVGAVSTYTWTTKAFVNNYNVDTTAGENITWTGTLNLTGSPVRT
jgi:hypothetical protein